MSDDSLEADRAMMHDFMFRNWGFRCDEYADLCPCCEAWKAFDVIAGHLDDA